MYKILKNKRFGYYEIIPKPSEEDLRNYYKDKYYQNGHGTYENYYEKEEVAYFRNKVAQKDYVVKKFLPISANTRTLLDIGCGEGFTLSYYHKKGWVVTGVDFSDYGLKINHPHLLPYLKQGNIFEEIQELAEDELQFDIVWLDNVLEHVRKPESLIQQCYRLTKNGGLLVIEVPNDYSDFQETLLQTNKIQKKYWEAFPDHLNYFSYQSLKNICEYNGWKTKKVISDFPIEWYLADNHSNYVNTRQLGKEAHHARIFIENFLHNNQKNNPGNLINFYESMAKVGMGRQIIGFFAKK